MLRGVGGVWRRSVCRCSRNSAGGAADIFRAYEEILMGGGETAAQCLHPSRTTGATGAKMPAKKVCIIGSGNW